MANCRANVVLRVCFAAAALIVAVSPLPTTGSTCRVRTGERILLASVSHDPNVFVWDARARLVDYAAGRHGTIDDVVRHALLVKPGTRAIVAMCAGGVVKLRYVVDPYDAVGLKITAGPYRNRWGWVNSDDIHPIR